jgi:hypothetical protein
MEVEPRESIYSYAINSQLFEFTVADQKAFYTELYTELVAYFAGVRNQVKMDDWVYDENHETAQGKIKDTIGEDTKFTHYQAFWDVTPKNFLLTFTNTIGIEKKGLVIDRYTGAQVWNQPIAGYQILPIQKEDILTFEEKDGQKLFPVVIKTHIFWAEDGVGEMEISEEFDITKISEKFHYNHHVNKHYKGRGLKFILYFDEELKLSDDGKEIVSVGNIVGDGVWYHQTQKGRDEKVDDTSSKTWKEVLKHTHPDFMWSPAQVVNYSEKERYYREKPPAMTVDRVRYIFSTKVGESDPSPYTIKTLEDYKNKHDQLINSSIKDFKKRTHLFSLKKNLIKQLKVPGHYSTYIFYNSSKLPKDYIKQLNELLLSTYKSFIDKVDSLITIKDFEGRLWNYKKLRYYKKKKIINYLRTHSFENGLVNNVADFMSIITPNWTNPTLTQLAHLFSFAQKKIPWFLKHHESINDLVNLQAWLISTFPLDSGKIEIILKLKEAGLKLVKNKQDYIHLMDYGMGNPPKEYKEAIDTFRTKNPYKDPTLASIN